MATEREINTFLSTHQSRAFKRTLLMVHDESLAMDILQETMLKLVEKYSHKPVEELPFLFHTILSNNTMDWFRKNKKESALFKNYSDFETEGEDNAEAIVESLSTLTHPASSEEYNQKEILQIIQEGIALLPERQKEAFMLRYWEDMNISDTAQIMQCSEGSVKTHCSRASATLAQYLHAKGIDKSILFPD